MLTLLILLELSVSAYGTTPVVREDQDSPTIWVPNGGSVDVQFNHTHSAIPGNYYLNLLTTNPDPHIMNEPDIFCSDRSDHREETDIYFCKTMTCRRESIQVDTYILTVRGNPALNDTELYCQYRAGEPLHNCNQETNAIIRIYDKTEANTCMEECRQIGGTGTQTGNSSSTSTSSPIFSDWITIAILALVFTAVAVLAAVAMAVVVPMCRGTSVQGKEAVQVIKSLKETLTSLNGLITENRMILDQLERHSGLQAPSESDDD